MSSEYISTAKKLSKVFKTRKNESSLIKMTHNFSCALHQNSKLLDLALVRAIILFSLDLYPLLDRNIDFVLSSKMSYAV